MTEFNWIVELEARAANKPSPFGRTTGDLMTLAGSWPTCACGTLCKDLPKLCDSSIPSDTQLRGLGYDFYDHIKACQFSKALATFHEIEARTAYLLSEDIS